jgi:hypothetical protein
MILEFKKLLELKEKEGCLSSKKCEAINLYLSTIKIGHIKDDQRNNVAGYLVDALNMNNVKEEFIESLQQLLNELQTSYKAKQHQSLRSLESFVVALFVHCCAIVAQKSQQ